MAKVNTKKPTPKNESNTEKKVIKKTTPKVEKVSEKKETPQDVIVLNALNNKFPMWTNGLALETDLLEAIHPVQLRDVLDKLVANKMVQFDLGTFSYQITEYGKNLLDNVLDNAKKK